MLFVDDPEPEDEGGDGADEGVVEDDDEEEEDGDELSDEPPLELPLLLEPEDARLSVR